MSDSSSETLAMEFKTLNDVTATFPAEESTQISEPVVETQPLEEQSIQQEETTQPQEKVTPENKEDDIVARILRDMECISTNEPNQPSQPSQEMQNDTNSSTGKDLYERVQEMLEIQQQKLEIEKQRQDIEKEELEREIKEYQPKQEAADTPSNSDIQEDDNLSQAVSEVVDETDNDELDQETENTDDTDYADQTDNTVKKEHEIPFPITCTFTLLMLVYGVKATALLLGFMGSVCKSTCECSR